MGGQDNLARPFVFDNPTVALNGHPRMTIAEEAESRLLDANYQQLRRVKVKQINGSTIILEGVVGSFFLKQMAQQAVLTIEGIRIQNNLIVEGGKNT